MPLAEKGRSTGLGNHSEHETLGELLANSITHGVGAVLAIVGLVVLLVRAYAGGNPWAIVSVAIFGVSLFSLYLISTLYHSLTRTRAMRVFQFSDHLAIYLLIAGTYAPVTLITLHGPLGWTLLGVVWGLAVVGILTKAIFMDRAEVFSVVLYLVMGWACVAAFHPLQLQAPPTALHLLVWGGVIYSSGIIFYCWTKLRYHHAVWHLFVMGGSLCHFLAVFNLLP